MTLHISLRSEMGGVTVIEDSSETSWLLWDSFVRRADGIVAEDEAVPSGYESRLMDRSGSGLACEGSNQ